MRSDGFWAVQFNRLKLNKTKSKVDLILFIFDIYCFLLVICNCFANSSETLGSHTIIGFADQSSVMPVTYIRIWIYFFSTITKTDERAGKATFVPLAVVAE